MRIAFFVNDIHLEKPNFTTTWLAHEALKLGHDIWYIGAGEFVYDADDRLRAHACAPRHKEYASNEQFLDDLQEQRAKVERLTVEDLDVLMLRNDPSLDMVDRPWVYSAGILFGQLAAQRGVLVLNDPDGLSRAMNKLYFQQLPKEVRPETLITRDRADVQHFVKQHGGSAVLKPLQGSGGRSVFLVQKGDSQNLPQMIEAVSRDGYVIAQAYLPQAKKGDLRLFLLGGAPLEHKGKLAALARQTPPGELRSNMYAGGQAAEAHVHEAALRIADLVRPRLVQDGMYLVGLDIVGDKLMEINVFTPGGLYSVKKLTRVNFPKLIVQDLERKLEYRRLYPALGNAQVAML